MLKVFSMLLFFYSSSAFAGVPFTLCNGDGAVDEAYYSEWKKKCDINPEQNYLACVRENAAASCDMPYQDMQGEITGKKFVLKRRNVKEIGKWNIMKHKKSFALKLVAKPEPETDWGDYVFKEIYSTNDGDIAIKDGVVVKCKIEEVYH